MSYNFGKFGARGNRNPSKQFSAEVAAIVMQAFLYMEHIFAASDSHSVLDFISPVTSEEIPKLSDSLIVLKDTE